MRAFIPALILAAGFAACVLINPLHAETTSVAMVPKSQLDALQKRFDALEDKLRREPQCLRMWTNAPRSI